jgi:phosphoglycerate dehydrogenase-like enzyme
MGRKYERSMVLAAKRCKWLHVGGTGIDRLYPLEELDPAIVISNTPGLNAELMADYVICTMLMLIWDFPRILRNQAERKWERWPVRRPEEQTLALIGVGDIGRPVGRRAAALGMRVIGVKRSPEPVPGVEKVYGPSQLHQALGEADVVVVAVPLTRETRGMFGPREFAAMKRTAFLINVSRGRVIQESELIKALKEGCIAGAALDVFEKEPLPPESELWSLRNVIVTPHTSCWSTDFRARGAEFFAANLERYLQGKPLLHVIDREKGY